MEEKEVGLAIGTEHKGRVVGVLGAASDVVAEAECLAIEPDCLVGVVNGDLDLNGTAASDYGHGDSFL
ncbi:MAG: hypothetical protein LC713_01945 [Actinobacteria bacterium]|nr:hypothetical protein [Actinomycetota bacterium]